MYNNIYAAQDNLVRLDPSVGGVCRIYMAPIQHINSWPVINPLIGAAPNIPSLLPGKVWYSIDNMPANAIYKEEEQDSNAGIYVKMQVTMPIADDSNANSLRSLSHRYHQFVIIIEEQNGMVRMIGSKDAGARITQNYSSADEDGTRQRIINMFWEHEMPALLITSATLPGTTTTINISFMLIEEFKVGAVGAPMIPGQTTYTHPSLSTSVLPVVFADGFRVPSISGGGRYYTYNYLTKTITWLPGVNQDEIIAIYN